MWRTSHDASEGRTPDRPQYDRVLKGAELRFWRLAVVQAICLTRDCRLPDFPSSDPEAVRALEDELDSRMDEDEPTGVTLADEMTVRDYLTTLWSVWQALADESIPPPGHSAHAEAVIYSVFQAVNDDIAGEIDLQDQINSEGGGRPFSDDWWHLRRAAWAALLEFRSFSSRDSFDALYPTGITDSDPERWGNAVEFLADRILWDRDFELADTFADLPPTEAHAARERFGIDEDYFTRVADHTPTARLCEMLDQMYWADEEFQRTDPQGEAVVYLDKRKVVGVTYADPTLNSECGVPPPVPHTDTLRLRIDPQTREDLRDYLRDPHTRKGRSHYDRKTKAAARGWRNRDVYEGLANIREMRDDPKRSARGGQ